MTKEFERFKGIHPGAVFERELNKRKLSQRPFALSIGEHPQSLNAIIKRKRGMSTPLALKIEKALDIEEGTFMILQVYHDIRKEKQKQNALVHPDFSIINKVLFWDTDINKIDWEQHYKYVIKRVFQRGDDEEKREIFRFYGKERIKEVTGRSTISGNSLPIMPHLEMR
ncbi:MAG TPA: helix-turn-helix domain-containing protein [Pedobacter sp.]|uniref:helix-turn-helix transcriptional regulator n=1 Tax=Pedobacter sp. TaxID=1411316 RepID=UPI002BF0A24A|nr:helix-turn-helix domain-containing protein [Pedobacter sp.]HMI01037.1 helix-turn-helix domain-containing protein [Pedobacter sp.]